MNTESKNLLINRAGKKRYTDLISIDNLIKYVTRTNGQSDEDLISWGGLGVTEFLGIPEIINQFHLVQKMHTRQGNFGRYIDHELFTLSSEEIFRVCEKNIDLDKVAREMAYDFYNRDNCQVVYGVHCPPNGHIHFHFAINTVNYTNGKKRRENKKQTSERNLYFQKILDNEINKNL